MRDQDKAVTAHRQHVGALDITRENHGELIAGAQLVIRRNRAAEKREELRRRTAKHIDSEHIVAYRQRFRGKRLDPLADEPRVHRKCLRAEGGDIETECLHRGEHLRVWLSRLLAGSRPAQVGVQQVRGITVRDELGSHLVWCQARLVEPLTELRCELRVLREQLHQLVGRHPRRQPRNLGWHLC